MFRKTVIFLADGMADEPIAALGGKTPLMAARTPAMDAIAREGCSGTLLTLPKGFPTSSDVANMSVLGCDLKTEYCGRGVLEAASQGIPLGKDDVAFRVNLVSVADDGTLADFSGGHIAQAHAEAAIAALNAKLSTDAIKFYPGVSYRNLLVLSGAEFCADVACDKPDDNFAQRVAEHLPRASSPRGEKTAETLRLLMSEARGILAKEKANAIWPWSPGQAGAMKTLNERYGISGAVISAVDVIKGLGRCLGMDVIDVPGATGYIDTNFAGKAAAAVAEWQAGQDLVYLHFEAPDECGHHFDAPGKVRAIELIDEKVIGPVFEYLQNSGERFKIIVMPDHPTLLSTGTHKSAPVPCAVYTGGENKNNHLKYTEKDAAKGRYVEHGSLLLSMEIGT
ncbi:MAG: cofactor-independent phosphoglycerate mutase [Kiritimatiellaeota bacterium]|nr:cofactor-independent phosphoglycerate mutase [Kiritimatiellota bacterium]